MYLARMSPRAGPRARRPSRAAGRARASWRRCPRTPPGRGRGPAARARARGRSGARRRSRPRRRPPARAHSMRARRRSGPSTTPVGNWCAGVSRAAPAPVPASAATSMPVPVHRRRPAPAGPSARAPRGCPATPGPRRRCRGSPVDEHLRRQRQRLRDARDHHHVVGLRPNAAGPAEPARQLGAQPGMPLRVAVAERAGRDVAEHRPGAAEPGGARERRQVGQPRREVDPVRRGAGPRRPRRSAPGAARRRPGCRARPGRHRESLVDEPLVGLDDHTARHPQPGRHPARRRQAVVAWPACRRRSRCAARRSARTRCRRGVRRPR